MNGLLGLVLQIFFIIVVSLTVGYTAFTISTDFLWGGFGALAIISLYTLSKILDSGNYLGFLVSFLITTLLAAAFLLFKMKPNSLVKNAAVNVSNNYFDILKANTTGNDALFFWSMFTASTITIFGLLLAKSAYSKMKSSGGIQGPKGVDGDRGEKGDTSEKLNSSNEIAYKHLLLEVNLEIEKYMIQNKEAIEFTPGEAHLKNYFVLENLRRIIYSNEFNKVYIDTLYSRVLRNATVPNKKCARENIALEHAIEKVVFDSKKWIRYLLSYKNGLKFLTSEFATSRDWETLYLKSDNISGLDKDPLKKLEEGIPTLESYINDDGGDGGDGEGEAGSNKWNWGNCRN
jgi:hypothetical protein